MEQLIIAAIVVAILTFIVVSNIKGRETKKVKDDVNREVSALESVLLQKYSTEQTVTDPLTGESTTFKVLDPTVASKIAAVRQAAKHGK